MGFADRQYARSTSGQPTAIGAMRMWSVTTWLIVLNVLVYVLDQMTDGLLANWGYFSASTVIGGLQIWRFITFQFLHANFQHILFNMIALYFFGPLIEGYLGSRKYLAFYLLCGIGGALMYLVLWGIGVLPGGAQTPMVGASAGIFGVLIASARVAPNARVMLLFPPIPMRMRTFAIIMLGIAVWTVFSNGRNAGGEAAHLGGAAIGALLIWQPHVLNVFDRIFGRRGRGRFRGNRTWPY
jgi:membrane associated rhomboid family serine protease